jgi:glycerophosphoryl diester phosphodiesterase
LVHPYTFRRDQLPPGIDSYEALLSVFIEQAGVDGVFTDFPDLSRVFIDRHSKMPESGPEDSAL